MSLLLSPEPFQKFGVVGGWWSKGILEFRFGPNLWINLKLGPNWITKPKKSTSIDAIEIRHRVVLQLKISDTFKVKFSACMEKLFPGRLKLKSAQHQSTHHQCCDASWQRAGAICPVSLNKSSIIYLVFVIGTWVRFFFYSVTAVVRSSLAGVEIIAAITLAPKKDNCYYLWPRRFIEKRSMIMTCI